jgi:hypothetical protein
VRDCFAALVLGPTSGRGRAEEGLVAIAEAMELMMRNGEHLWEAELARIEGEMRRLQDASASELEGHFQRALAISPARNAKAFELRAARDLARLWAKWAGALKPATSSRRFMAGSPKASTPPI